MNRDVRLDLIRGFALVTVTINHITQLCRDMGLSGPSFPTPSKFTLSSSLETFILLSGILVGIIYTRTFFKKGFKSLFNRTFLRLAQIIITQLLVGAAVLVCLYFGSDNMIRASFLKPVADFWELSWKTATGAMPFAMNVLPLYVLLLAFAPLQVVGLARFPAATFLACAALYVLAHLGLNLLVLLPEGAPLSFGKGYFNPFSYQFLFMVGILWGQNWNTVWPKIENFGERHLVLLSVANLGFMGWCVAMKAGILPSLSYLFERSDIDFLVIFSGLLFVWWQLVLIKKFPLIADNSPARLLSGLGCHSLLIFGAGIPLTYAAALVWDISGQGTFSYYLVCIAAIVGLLGIKNLAELFTRLEVSVRGRLAQG